MEAAEGRQADLGLIVEEAAARVSAAIREPMAPQAALVRFAYAQENLRLARLRLDRGELDGVMFHVAQAETWLCAAGVGVSDA